MKSKIYFIMIPLLALVTMIGIALSIYNLRESKNKVTDADIFLNGERLTTSEVSLSGMAPGEYKEYTLHLSSDKKATYTVTLEFQAGKEVTLAEYVSAEISIGEQMIGREMLSQYLRGEKIQFDCSLAPGNKVVVKVRFAMDINVGNEAQGTKADFVIVLSAIKK